MGRSYWVRIINQHKLEFLNRAKSDSVNSRLKRRIADRVEELTSDVIGYHTPKFLIFGTDVKKSLESVEHRVDIMKISSRYGDFDTNTQKRVEADAFDFMRTLFRELKNGYKVTE